MARRRVDPAAARAARLAALVALMPSGLAQPLQDEWQALSEAIADDPPSWSPSPRYRDVMREFCLETVRIAAYRSALQTINLEIYREKTPGGVDRVKVHPYVALLDQALKRWRELSDMLELSPRAARKKDGLFDAA